jgi:hypothetical protein
MSADEEQRVEALLRELRDEPVPDDPELAARVARTARWQRPVRLVLHAVGELTAAVASGVALAAGARKREEGP